MTTGSMHDELPLVSALAVDPEDPEAARARSSIESRLLDTPLVPPRIGRFVVLERLGAGGMGIVYAAYDPQLDRKVALKLLFERDTDRHERERLVREAKAMAKLAHPNVVHVYDVGEHRGRIFVAMEHIRGRTLRAWLGERHRPWRETLAVCIEAGRGLAAAHLAGIVHRDFKPENVLVGDDGRARVLDFGLARAIAEPTEPDIGRPLELIDATSRATKTGSVVGTPGYMAPEQIRGERADATSDQFSFCATVWEALTGTLPFPGRTLAAIVESTMTGHVAAPPRGTMPGWIERLLRRGLAEERRFASLDELLHALGRDPARIRARRLGVAAVAVGIAGAFAVGTSMQRGQVVDEPCSGSEQLMEEAWPSADRELALVRLAHDGGAYGEALAPRLREQIADYAASWSANHRDACLAHQRGEQSAELLDRRMTCLHRGRSALTTFGAIAADVEPNEVAQLAMASTSLPDPHRCADLVALETTTEPPPPEAGPLAERLADTTMLFAAGRLDAARAAAESAVIDARTLGYPALLAEALSLHGRILLEQPDRRRGAALLKEAVRLAIEAGADEIAVEAWGQMAWAIATGEGDPDGSLLGGRELVIALAARRPHALSTMSLHQNLGGVANAAGKDQDARAAYEHVIANTRVDTPAGRKLVAVAKENAANLTDDPEAVVRLLADAVATWTELAGPQHPRTLGTRLKQLMRTPDFLDRRDELAELCRDIRTYGAKVGYDLALCEMMLADASELADDHAVSVAATDRWVAASSAGHDELARGYAALRHGRWEEAAAIFADIIRRSEALEHPRWWEHHTWARAEAGLAAAWGALGKPGAAAMVQRGILRLETTDSPTTKSGRDRYLALARKVARELPAEPERR